MLPFIIQPRRVLHYSQFVDLITHVWRNWEAKNPAKIFKCHRLVEFWQMPVSLIKTRSRFWARTGKSRPTTKATIR